MGPAPWGGCSVRGRADAEAKPTRTAWVSLAFSMVGQAGGSVGSRLLLLRIRQSQEPVGIQFSQKASALHSRFAQGHLFIAC